MTGSTNATQDAALRDPRRITQYHAHVWSLPPRSERLRSGRHSCGSRPTRFKSADSLDSAFGDRGDTLVGP